MLSLVCFILFGFACESNKNGPPEVPQGYPAIILLKAAHLVGLVDLVDTKPAVPTSLNAYKDIVYKTTNNDTLKLDVYQPKNLVKPRPALIFIHGGGWRKGKKESSVCL